MFVSDKDYYNFVKGNLKLENINEKEIKEEKPKAKPRKRATRRKAKKDV